MQDSHITYLTAAYVITALLLAGEIVLLHFQIRRVQKQLEQD